MDETRLSRESVAEGALALIDAEGLDALTIRRLAQSKGVTPMALYWHFKNKEELLVGVAERLWSLMDTRPDRSLPPLARVRALLESLISVLRAHREAVPVLSLSGSMTAPSCLDAMEAALSAFADAGLSTKEAAGFVHQGLRLVMSLVTGEPGAGPANQSRDEIEEQLRCKRALLLSLSPDRYPHVIEAAADLTALADPDAYYALGVDLFLSGIEAHVTARETSQTQAVG
jgi:AcrR family transcriptional regulator